MNDSVFPQQSSDQKNIFGFSVESSWGVASLRQCAGFPGSVINSKDKKSYIAPLGALVTCWDVETKQRKFSFQAHSDLITVMLHNTRLNVVLTACYSGEFKLWSSNWELLLSLKARVGSMHFADWSVRGDRFLICGGEESVMIVYNLVKCDGKRWEIQEKWSVAAPQNPKKLPSNNVGDDIVKLVDAKTNQGSSTFVEQKDYYDMAIFTPENGVIAVLQRHRNDFSEAHLYSHDGTFLKSQTLDPLGDTKSSLMCLSPCHNSVFAVGFQGGLFLLLNEHDLSVISVFQATGSAQVALWDGDYLLAASYLSGVFSWWNINGELVNEVQGGPSNSIIHLNWAVPGKQLWVGGIMSIHYVTLNFNNPEERFPNSLVTNQTIEFLEVTGCGIALDDSNLVLVGDFSGNVLVWERGKSNPVLRTKHESSIRCLTWNNGYAFIGCLDGDLLRWLPGRDSFPSTALTCIGGVMTMAWSQDLTSLAIGLGTGYLCMYKFVPVKSPEPEEMLSFRAHVMIKDGHEIAAEVWSVCWSPCGTMIVTASEDQTAVVWKAANGEKVETLIGHTTAVTSVDWKEMSSGEQILATCADDRTVHIRDGTTFLMKHVLDTKDIPGWYTLTYLSLNPVRQWCLCSTQNGHLVLWDCVSGERLGCRKMHAGSIEGLVWNKDYTLCATVSSDCVLSVFSVNELHCKL
ncbi:uncharacterized protein [Montipora capricornis]|uniref:uncharacterized protein n=1 Tax=Montipora capricornis TaxID=246305 RepID=UPI0035F1853B